MEHKELIAIVKQLLTELQLPFTDATATQEEDAIRVDIAAPKPSLIIGWHGETLNALQILVKAIMKSTEGDKAATVVLDVDGYRRMQEDKIRGMADQKAEFVRRTKSRVALAPMSPYFRRIVHLHIARTHGLQDMTTESIGEGDYRQVVIKLKEGSAKSKVSDDQELSPVIDAPMEAGLENLDV